MKRIFKSSLLPDCEEKFISCRNRNSFLFPPQYSSTRDRQRVAQRKDAFLLDPALQTCSVAIILRSLPSAVTAGTVDSLGYGVGSASDSR